MKLISLNSWAGAVTDPFLKFIKRHHADTDIFCLQEIYNSAEIDSGHDQAFPKLYDELKNILTDFQPFFAGAHTSQGRRNWGNATFIKKTLQMIEAFDIYENNELLIPDEYGYVPYCGLYTELADDQAVFSLINHHGLWAKDTNKQDVPIRIEQAKKLRQLLDNKTGKVIITGDFNLLPDTKTIKLLETGLINLIKVHKISSTRSKLYDKPIKFADYTLVSPNISVQNFTVLPDVISDHLALQLIFT